MIDRHGTITPANMCTLQSKHRLVASEVLKPLSSHRSHQTNKEQWLAELENLSNFNDLVFVLNVEISL